MTAKEHTSGNTQPPSHPARKRRFRLILRLLIYPFALLIILLLAAFLSLQTETARSAVKAFIEKTAAQHLQADLRIEKISGSLLFDISLEQVRISRRGGSILTAEKVSAGYLLPLLLTRVLMLSEVEIDGMVLNITREEDGRLNIATLMATGQTPEATAFRPLPLTIIISRISIFDSAVVLTDRQAETSLERRISNIALTAGLELSSSGMVSVRVINLSLDLDKPALHIAGLNGRVGFAPDKNRLDFKDVRLRLNESDFTFNGSLDLDPAGMRFNLHTAINPLSLPEIGQIFSIPTLDRGRLSGALRLKGTPGRFTHEADLNLDGMSLLSSGPIRRTESGSFSADVSATVRHLNPAALPLTAFNDISGDINSDIRLQGTDLNLPGRRGRLSMEIKPSRISGFDLTAAKIEAAFDKDGIVLEHSFLSTPRGSVAIHHAVADLLDPARPGRLRLDASIQDLDPSVSGRSDLSGKIRLDLKAAAVFPPPGDKRFDPAAIIAEFSADIGPSKILDIEIGSGRIQTAWNGRDLTVQLLELAGGIGRLKASGSLTPKDRNSRLGFEAHLPDIEPVARLVLRLWPDRFPALKQPYPEGRLNLSGELKGWWDRPDLSLAVSGSNMKYDQVSLKNFDLKGTFKGTPQDFKATAASGVENLIVNDNRLSRVDLELQLGPDHALAQLALKHEKGPALTTKGRLDGWRRPVKTITIETLRITSADRPRDRAKTGIEEVVNSGPIRLTLSTAGAFEIVALKLISKEAALSVAGGISADGRINAIFSVNRLDFNRVPRFIDVQEKFSGVLSADLELTGTLARPIFQTHLRIKEAAGFDFSFSDLDILLKYGAEKAAFKVIGHLRQNKILDFSGEVGALCSLQPFKFQLQSGGFNAAIMTRNLKLSALPIPKTEDFKLDGILSLNVQAHGDLKAPKFNGSLSVTDGFFTIAGKSPVTVSFSKLNVAIGFNGSQADVKAVLHRNGQKALDLNARAGFRLSLHPFVINQWNKDLKVSLNARGLKLSDFPMPRPAGFHYDGLLSLSLDIDGDPVAPVLKGQITLQEGFLAPENKDIRNYAFSDLKVNFSYGAAIADFSAALYRKEQKLLDLRGRTGMELSLMPFHWNILDDGFRLDAAARDLKLSMLPIPRQPGVDFDARLNVAASATGSPRSPVISGSLSLQDGFLNLINPALSYETVQAQVDFSPEGMVIREFLLKGDTEGTLSITGHIYAEGLKPTAFEMRLTGENVFVPYEKAATARIRPDLTLTGTLQKPSLAGSLTVTEGRVNLDQLSSRGPAEIQIVAPGQEKKVSIDIVEAPGAVQDLLRPLSAGIRVAIPKNAWLNGQGVNAEMAGEVNLIKEADKPFVLLGSLYTVRGTFDFRSRLFRITRGNIDFIGLEELNPNLDIEAETRIARVKIIVKITGTAEQMILELDSDPSMDRTDIVSYLVFGRPAGELTRQQSFNAEQAALNITGRLAANELKNILGEAFRLDVLTLEPGSGGIAEGSLAIGRYITPEVFVLYRHRFKVDEPNQVEVTYEISRNFSIETQLGDEKTTGIDLIWNFDY